MRLLNFYKAIAMLIKQKATHEIKISDKSIGTLNLLHVERNCSVIYCKSSESRHL